MTPKRSPPRWSRLGHAGFLNHDEVWGSDFGDPPHTPPRESFVDTRLDLGTFYRRAAEAGLAVAGTDRPPSFPYDWSEAKRKRSRAK